MAPTVAIGGPYSGTAGEAIVFAGSGSEPSSQETSSLTYLWNFGDCATTLPRFFGRLCQRRFLLREPQGHRCERLEHHSIDNRQRCEDLPTVSAGPSESGNEESAIQFSGSASGGIGACPIPGRSATAVRPAVR